MLLDGIDWTVGEGERWVVLGPNGAGKTTLLRIAATRAFPTSGSAWVLGEELGAVDLSELRPRVGWASGELADDIPPAESVADAVMTGAQAVTGRWREAYDPVDEIRAMGLLAQWGLTELATRAFGTLSEGERKRTLIARALMADPELLLLDEPGAGLDLAGREDLVDRLAALAADPDSPTVVLITHHVEEVPPGFTHALILASGRVIAAGPLDDVLDDASLSEAFRTELSVTRDRGRIFARRA